MNKYVHDTSPILLASLNITCSWRDKLIVPRLFVPQFVTTYFRDCGRRSFLDLHIMFWVLSPLIPQFMISCLKFLYQSSNLQRWSLLRQLSMCCFLFSRVLHVCYTLQATRFCKAFHYGRWFSKVVTLW